ncbi:uncharacterized protein LOC108810672 [Raphanus sativus]|uniref:Uncharacterized protein LOC108810672 n=1 Tax=Raphanus sativus TaxID=3726 RepID=A0A9W3BWY2_RAPSA|nr:uncharacterized protein LOC108810672 [Raphanus sativus]
MGAAEVLTDPSSLYEANYMGKGDLSDTDMVIAVRKTLASVQHGESDRYDELLETFQATKNSDLAAQLVSALKALSSSVAYLDIKHHQKLLSLVFGMSLWDLEPHVMDAFVGLLISLAVTTGMYVEACLNMLIRHFVPPDWVVQRLSQPRVMKQRRVVLSRVHEALLKIFILCPYATSGIMLPLTKNMAKINKESQVVEIFVENLLKLVNSPIGQVHGINIFSMVMERLRDMDLGVNWDGIPQDDSSRGIFDMELEHAVEDAMNEGDEVRVGSLNIDFGSLDKLMVIFFYHLESCKRARCLDEVFEMLFEAFDNFFLDTHKIKILQFVMFYTCSLDPENGGVKFASKLIDIFLFSNNPPKRMNAMAYLASYLARGKFLPVSYVASVLKRLVDECADYCRTCNDDISSDAHWIFYSGCQAIMYVLCFRMRSILDVPRFRSELIPPLESILMHALNPLKECLPSVVAEFLKQAKAGGLFVVSGSFIFDDLLESELSRCAFKGPEMLTFFPFDPCLLKSSNSFISRDFIYWSMVRPTYDEDDEEEEEDAEIIVNGDEESDEEDEDDDVDYDMNKMSITPKHSFINMMERDRLLKMPSTIRPSISPPSF